MSIEYNQLGSNTICKVDNENNRLEVYTLYSNSDIIQKIVENDDSSSDTFEYQNDRFTNMKGKQYVEVEYKKLCIDDYTSQDYKKYAQKRQNIFINESYVDYLSLLTTQDLRPSWMVNILNHQAEQNRILYESYDIIIILDQKCTVTKDQLDEFKQNPMDTDAFVNTFPNFYVLVLFKQVRIATIRDLSSSEVEYLERVNASIIEFLEESYNLPPKYVRLFFHYPPSFYCLHLHVNLTTSDFHYSVDHCHPLNQVIKNLRLSGGTYYQESMIVSKITT